MNSLFIRVNVLTLKLSCIDVVQFGVVFFSEIFWATFIGKLVDIKTIAI